jgi:putative sterol carrier protein
MQTDAAVCVQVSDLFQQMKDGIGSLPADEKKKIISQTKGIFQFDISGGEGGKKQTWTLDLKNDGAVIAGTHPSEKADITIAVSDDDFLAMSTGKLNGQKAFMSGKIKVKGKMMLATKLDTVLKSAQKAKL